MRWRWVWLLLAVLVLSVELYAVWSPAPGDTLSEQVIPLLMASQALWWAALVLGTLFAVWLLWHLLFQYRDREGGAQPPRLPSDHE